MRRDGDESRIKRLVWFYLSMNNTFLWGTNGCDAGKYGEKKSVLDKWYIMIVKLSMSQDFCINVSIKNWNLNMERLIIVFVLGFFFFHKILSAWMKRLNQKSSFYCYFFLVYQIRQSSASEIKLRITDKWSIISLYTWCAWASITIFSCGSNNSTSKTKMYRENTCWDEMRWRLSRECRSTNWPSAIWHERHLMFRKQCKLFTCRYTEHSVRQQYDRSAWCTCACPFWQTIHQQPTTSSITISSSFLPPSTYH